MKFQQLEIGARFEFEGKVYVKEGPVAARDVDTGKSRMIPRYAVLKPVGEMPKVSAQAAPKVVPRDAVLAAFEVFYTECGLVAAQCSIPDAEARLAAARQRFLTSF
jgi:hypothetical protein